MTLCFRRCPRPHTPASPPSVLVDDIRGDEALECALRHKLPPFYRGSHCLSHGLAPPRPMATAIWFAKMSLSTTPSLLVESGIARVAAVAGILLR